MREIHFPAPVTLERPTVIVPHEATGGVISFVEQSMAPRALIPGHVHERTDVWIYVLHGTVGVRVGDREAAATVGSYLLKPRAVPHAMWNPGDEPNRLIEILTPGEGDLFFRDLGDAARDGATFETVCARHGIRFFDTWTEDLRARHALT